MEIARRYAELLGIESRRMLLRRILPEQLQEPLAELLLPCVLGLVFKLFRHSAEKPYQESLEIVELQDIHVLRPVAAGEEHLSSVHPYAHLLPCQPAADILGMLVAWMFICIVEIRGIDREHRPDVDLSRYEKHPHLEIRSGGYPLKESTRQKYEFSLIAEDECLRTRRHLTPAAHTYQIYAADEMDRTAFQERQVGLFIAETAGIRQDGFRPCGLYCHLRNLSACEAMSLVSSK